MDYNKTIKRRCFPVKNQEVKNMAKQSGVRMWMIADALGIADTTFCRKLRRELPPEEKEKIFSIIRELAGEVG